MKKKQPTRKSIRKISTFLRGMGFNSKGQTESRQHFRQTSKLPNSTKIGNGNHVVRIRSLNQT